MPPPDDHLAGVDAGAGGDPDAVLAAELVVEPVERVADLGRRANGAERIVLVHDRHAEDGHDRVADELLDGAAVPLEHALHGVEVPPHHAAQELGVEPLAERGRLGDVCEEDGDDLPRLGRDASAREARAAAGAEPCVASFSRPQAGQVMRASLRRAGRG